MRLVERLTVHQTKCGRQENGECSSTPTHGVNCARLSRQIYDAVRILTSGALKFSPVVMAPPTWFSAAPPSLPSYVHLRSTLRLPSIVPANTPWCPAPFCIVTKLSVCFFPPRLHACTLSVRTMMMASDEGQRMEELICKCVSHLLQSLGYGSSGDNPKNWQKNGQKRNLRLVWIEHTTFRCLDFSLTLSQLS